MPAPLRVVPVGLPQRGVVAIRRIRIVRTADGDVVLAGLEAAHADAVRRTRCVRIAARRAFVTRRHVDRDALRRSVLIGGVVRCIGRCAVQRLALAVAHAEDLGRVGGSHHVLDGLQTAEANVVGSGVRAARQDDVRIRSRGAGVFGVENGFAVVTPVHARVRARRRTGRMHRRERGMRVLVQAHDGAERVPRRHFVDVGVFDHDDRLALTGDAGTRRSPSCYRSPPYRPASP